MKRLELHKLRPSDLDVIKIKEDVSDKVSYGRQFKVERGKSACTVVFQDLYLLARRLGAQASQPEDLHKISAFVEQLSDIEKGARDAGYNKGRSFWYKFRTFFHRVSHIFYQFYGVGSHLERLEKLNQSLAQKILNQSFSQLLDVSDEIIFQGFPSSDKLSEHIESAEQLKKNYQQLYGNQRPEVQQLAEIIELAEQKKTFSSSFANKLPALSGTFRDWNEIDLNMAAMIYLKHPELFDTSTRHKTDPQNHVEKWLHSLAIRKEDYDKVRKLAEDWKGYYQIRKDWEQAKPREELKDTKESLDSYLECCQIWDKVLTLMSGYHGRAEHKIVDNHFHQLLTEMNGKIPPVVLLYHKAVNRALPPFEIRSKLESHREKYPTIVGEIEKLLNNKEL